MHFLVRLGLASLLVASLGLFGLYALTPYADLAARVSVPNYGLEEGVAALPLTPVRYAALRTGLALLAGLVGTGLVISWRHRGQISRRCSVGFGRLGTWLQPFKQLSRGERWLAGALLITAAGVHLWYAIDYPLILDEIASYDYSVLPGAALTASYYPFPNNHILPNLLVGLVHGLLPGVGSAIALRLLPTLLGLVLLPLGYALLLRYLRFEAATLGWGLFNFSPLPAFYAIAGRGYAWALAALLAGLWASLQLLRPHGLSHAARQRAWSVFMLSAVLGLYAVPTHLYGLLGLGLALVVGFSRWQGQRRVLNLLHLTLAALAVSLTVAVLYAPVVAVSGWSALVANHYVTREPFATFWANVGPYYLLGTASELHELLGRRETSAGLFVLMAVLGPVALRWGGLPEPARRLGWLAYTQLVLWLPLLLVQRVYAPARTLLAVLLFLFVVAAVVGQALLQWLRPAWQRQPTPASLLLALVLVLSGYSVYRLRREQAVINSEIHLRELLGRSYTWMQARQPRRVWVPQGLRAFAIFWNHFALDAGQQPLPLVLPDVASHFPPATKPGPVYEVLLAVPSGRHAVYAEEQIVLLPAVDSLAH
jgi:uncharacterized membrane protein